jgi:hypothetical protein
MHVRDRSGALGENQDVQRVFPVVAMAVRSGGTLQLRQVAVLKKDGWEGRSALAEAADDCRRAAQLTS